MNFIVIFIVITDMIGIDLDKKHPACYLIFRIGLILKYCLLSRDSCFQKNCLRTYVRTFGCILPCFVFRTFLSIMLIDMFTSYHVPTYCTVPSFCEIIS